MGLLGRRARRTCPRELISSISQRVDGWRYGIRDVSQACCPLEVPAPRARGLTSSTRPGCAGSAAAHNG